MTYNATKYYILYMVTKGSMTPHIPNIFETVTNEKNIDLDKMPFSNDANLYQDILRYPLDTGSAEFKFWDLGRWLMKNNKEFLKYYEKDYKYSSKTRTTIRNAIENRKDRIVRKLEDLEKLGLLRITKVPAEKVQTETNQYSLTFEGYILILFGLRERKKNTAKLKDIENEIYAIISQYLQYKSTSTAVFIDKVYNKCLEKKLIDVLFDTMFRLLSTTSKVQDIFFSIILPVFVFPKLDERVRKMMSIFYDVLINLEDDVRRIIYFQLKLAYEAEILRKNSFSAWEQEWAKNMGNEKIMTLQTQCSNCKKFYPFPIETKLFFEYIFCFSVYPRINLPCDSCKQTTSAEISSNYFQLMEYGIDLPGQKVHFLD